MGGSQTKPADIPKIDGEVVLRNGGTFLSAEWRRPYFNGAFQYRVKLYRYVGLFTWRRVAIHYTDTTRYCFSDTKPGDWYKVKVGLENQHFRRGPTRKSKQLKYTPLMIRDLNAEKRDLHIVVSWRKIDCEDVRYFVLVHAERGIAQRPIPTSDNRYKHPLLPHKKLSFEVWAEHGTEKGASTRTEKISTGPEPVNNLRAQKDRDCIIVTWDCNDDSIKEYRVKVVRQGKFICEVPTPNKHFTLTRYKAARDYWFEVWAIDREGTRGPIVKSDTIKSPKRPPRDTGPHHEEFRNPIYDRNSRVEEVDTLLPDTSERVRVLPPVQEVDPGEVRLNLRERTPPVENRQLEAVTDVIDENATEAQTYFDRGTEGSSTSDVPSMTEAPVKVVFNIKEVHTHDFAGFIESRTDYGSSQRQERMKRPDEGGVGGGFSAMEARSSPFPIDGARAD